MNIFTKKYRQISAMPVVFSVYFFYQTDLKGQYDNWLGVGTMVWVFGLLVWLLLRGKKALFFPWQNMGLFLSIRQFYAWWQCLCPCLW